MKVLLTAKRFPPEYPATAVLGQELAEDLAQSGFQVTVAAGYPHHPYGRLFPGYGRKWLKIEETKGYRLLRGWHLVHPSPAIWARALVMVTHCFSYFLSAWHTSRPQVVISFDGYPLLGPLISALIARSCGARLITVLYDIYPDIAAELGKLRNPGLIKIAQVLEKLTYRLSDRIVVLSEGFRHHLVHEKGVEADKVVVIPVWLDAHEIVPKNRDNPWRREMGIPLKKFVVLYAGTIGLVSGAEVVLVAAKLLSAYPDILFLMVGDGYGKVQVEAQAKELQLKNVRFFPFQPRHNLCDLQATADVSLVTLASGRGRTSVPSKVLGYMAAARTVVASVDLDCDTATMIRSAGCGQVTLAGDGLALAEAILYYYRHPQERKLAGDIGRRFFLANFEKDAVLQQYRDLIGELVNIKSSPV